MCTWRWFYRCIPKGCKGSAGHVRCLLDHAAPTPLPLKQQGPRCDVNVDNLQALIVAVKSVAICTHRFNKGVSFENKVLFQFDSVRTHHMLPPLRKGEKEDAGRLVRTRYRNLSLALSAPSKF